MSDRSGTNQYFAVSTETGTIVQLTNDKQPGNAFLSRTENRMYYLSDRTIWDTVLSGPVQEHLSPSRRQAGGKGSSSDSALSKRPRLRLGPGSRQLPGQ